MSLPRRPAPLAKHPCADRWRRFEACALRSVGPGYHCRCFIASHTREDKAPHAASLCTCCPPRLVGLKSPQLPTWNWTAAGGPPEVLVPDQPPPQRSLVPDTRVGPPSRPIIMSHDCCNVGRPMLHTGAGDRHTNGLRYVSPPLKVPSRPTAPAAHTCRPWLVLLLLSWWLRLLRLVHSLCRSA